MSAIKAKRTEQRYERASRARDARFDGVFFTAVKTTGIYCRSICPANQPLEKNVEYHESAVSAAQAGFRPCLRCRPDSAPESSAWLGTETTFQRALSLIQQGALQQGSLVTLADRLGVSDRYIRDLFQKNLGTSPIKYSVYQQCLFAKQLLHESDLSITEIAYASGFNSVRRFNEAIKQQLGLAPRQIRKSDKRSHGGISLKLYYRPPYAWQPLMTFLQSRVIPGLEWTEGDTYGRTFTYQGAVGYFTITAVPDKHRFDLFINVNNTQCLSQIVQRIRLMFDVDAPIERIDDALKTQVGSLINYQPGLRVPGIWNSFEAGMRAILGQQISVVAARNLVIAMVENLGQKVEFANTPAQFLFPEPAAVVDHSLDFFRMPQSRKDTIRRLADYFLENDAAVDTRQENRSARSSKASRLQRADNLERADNIDAWLDIKGIGPWTVNYVKMRASKDPDIWLVGDAGLKNALKGLDQTPDLEKTKPWRSYLTLQMWNQL